MSDFGVGIIEAMRLLSTFGGESLGSRIADLEWQACGCDRSACIELLADSGVTAQLLAAACAVKSAVGQINVVVHTLGVLLVVPKILEEGERVEYVSLGAGNTGRAFDLETDRRVAEFKFINWRGGAEAIRQNSLFKDFYLLAEHESPKRKELYVLDPTYPRQFLRGGRAIASVLSRNVKLKAQFEGKYGGRFAKVGDYFRFRQHDVRMIDAATLVPELRAFATAMDDDEPQSQSPGKAGG